MDKTSKTGRIVKIVLFSILIIGIVGYLAYYMLHLSEADPETKCTGIELIIEDEVDDRYVNQEEIQQILNKAHISTTGKMMRDINANEIEKFIKANPFVKDVNCFKSSTGKVIVKVSQKIPVIYVLPTGRKGYFLDKEGTIIPKDRYVSNIIIATGTIDEKYATKELLPLALFINNNDFWDNQIEQIYVKRDRKNKRVIELVPRVGDQIIYLGAVKGFEKKFRRLKIFYDKAVNTVGWNRYSRINLEYDNQIICTKHKK